MIGINSIPELIPPFSSGIAFDFRSPDYFNSDFTVNHLAFCQSLPEPLSTYGFLSKSKRTTFIIQGTHGTIAIGGVRVSQKVLWIQEVLLAATTFALKTRQHKAANRQSRNMTTKIKVTTTYNCSLERAFKSPILCDISKVHTGYGVMPKVTHCTDDQHWGQPGSTKKVYVAKSLTQKGGFSSVDKVIERIENKYWKIEVSDFQAWMLGFSKFTGEWQTTEIEKNKILIEYTYTLHSDVALFYPLNWIFAKTFWKIYMKRVLENIRRMTDNKEPYAYD